MQSFVFAYMLVMINTKLPFCIKPISSQVTHFKYYRNKCYIDLIFYASNP